MKNFVKNVQIAFLEAGVFFLVSKLHIKYSFLPEQKREQLFDRIRVQLNWHLARSPHEKRMKRLLWGKLKME